MKVNVAGNGVLTVPDFFVLGAAKSGTTSLHRYLEQHPDVCMPRRKESWFFSSNFSGAGLDHEVNTIAGMVTDIRSYARLYNGCRSGQLLGEASPSCLYTHRATIANIRAIYSDEEALARLRYIIILRNPVERTWAQYRTHQAWLHEDLSLRQAVDSATVSKRLSQNLNPFYDYIGFGRYADQVAAYFTAFGKDRVRVVLFEDLRDDPAALCRDLFSFLGIDEQYRPPNLAPRNAGLGEPHAAWFTRLVRSSGGLKSACLRVVPERARKELKGWLIRKGSRAPSSRLDDETRAFLAPFFADDIARLEGMISRDLGHWMAPGASVSQGAPDDGHGAHVH